MSKGRILFVEDDPALAELVRFHLSREGYQVLQTGDGDEALLLADRLRRPTEIAVRPAGRFTEITAYRFAPCLTSVPGSAPSAIESPAAGAGSTRASASPTRGATRAAETSAAGFARTFATGGRA